MENLMSKFEPGINPNIIILETFGDMALANARGMIPFVSVIMDTLLPLFSNKKSDVKLKLALLSLFGKFAESLLDYTSMDDIDPNVSKSSFSSKFFSVITSIHGWLPNSRDEQLIVSILYNAGLMARALNIDDINNILQKLITCFNSYDKKYPECVKIKQGFQNVLLSATEDCTEESSPMTQHLDSTLNILFQQMLRCCSSKTAEQKIHISKNVNEILRSFGVLAVIFTKTTIHYILSKIDHSTLENIFIAAFSILKHLVNCAGEQIKKESLEENIAQVTKGLTVGNKSTKIKKYLIHLIATLVTHGYLDMEGNLVLLDYMVLHSATPCTDNNELVTLSHLCMNVLQVMACTQKDLKAILSPYMLQYIVMEPYQHALHNVCTTIAAFLAPNEDEAVQVFDLSQSSIARSCALLPRFLVYLGGFSFKSQQDAHAAITVLKLLKLLSPSLHLRLITLWNGKIPELIKFIEDNMDKLTNQNNDDIYNEWQNNIGMLFRKSLEEISNEVFVLTVIESMKNQFSLCSVSKYQRIIWFKCFAYCLYCCHANSSTIITNCLNFMIEHVNQTDKEERTACSSAVGIVASSHIDLVFSRIQSLYENEKKNSFVEFFKENFQSKVEYGRITLLLCLAHSIQNSPVTNTLLLIETRFLRIIIPLLKQKLKLDNSMKWCLIECCRIIADSLHPNKKLPRSLEIVHKKALLEFVLRIMKEAPSLIADCLRALISLIRLPPILPGEQFNDLLLVSFTNVLNATTDEKNKEEKSEDYNQLLTEEKLNNEITDLFQELLKLTVEHDGSSSSAMMLCDHIGSQLLTKNDFRRQKTMHLYNGLLLNANHSLLVDDDVRTKLIGITIPRCSDSVDEIKEYAHKSMMKLVCSKADYLDQLENNQFFRVYSELYLTKDPSEKYKASSNLALSICDLLAPRELTYLIHYLLPSLSDPCEESQAGVSVCLNTIFKTKPLDLEIGAVVGHLVSKLAACSESTRLSCLSSIKTLASRHLHITLECLLLGEPSESIKGVWGTLATDSSLSSHVLDYFVDAIVRQPPHHMQHSIAYALLEMLQANEIKPTAIDNFSKIFSSLLVYLGSLCFIFKHENYSRHNNKEDDRDYVVFISRATSTMTSLFRAVGADGLLDYVKEYSLFANFLNGNFVTGIAALSGALSTFEYSYVPKCSNCLQSALTAVHDSHRITAAIFFSEILGTECIIRDDQLFEIISNNLLSRLEDPCHDVRIACMKGLGFISKNEDILHSKSSTVLSALMIAMDDKSPHISHAAICSLQLVLSSSMAEDVRPIIINIAVKVKCCFESEFEFIRASAFLLYAHLAKFRDAETTKLLTDVFNGSFVTLLVHVNDPCEMAKKNCQQALKELVPLLPSVQLTTMFAKCMDNDLHYGEFMNSVAKIIVDDLGNKLTVFLQQGATYTKSSVRNIRAAALMFCGFILKHCKDRSNLPVDVVSQTVLQALKDQDTVVRLKAAEVYNVKSLCYIKCKCYQKKYDFGGRWNFNGDANGDDDDCILRKSDIVENGWKVLRKLGGGSFGQVYEIRKGSQMCAIKVEGIKGTEKQRPSLKREFDIIRRIERKYKEYSNGDIKFPVNVEFNRFCYLKGFSVELEDDDYKDWKHGGTPINHNKFIAYYYIIMELMGRNLTDLRRNEPDQKFGIYTISYLALETFKAIKTLHAIGFVHRDIKPSNFVLGKSRNREIFLVDFGLAYTFGRLTKVLSGKRVLSTYPPHFDYVNPERRNGAGFRGTVRYASLRAHREEYLSYQDDLISWFYMLIEMSTGALPWRKVKKRKDVQKIKEKYINVNNLLIFSLHDENGRLGESYNLYEVPDKLQPTFKHIYKRIMNINIRDPIDMDSNFSVDPTEPPNPRSQNNYTEIELLLIKLRNSIGNMKNIERKLDWESRTNSQFDKLNSTNSVGAVVEYNGYSKMNLVIPPSEIVDVDESRDDSKAPRRYSQKVALPNQRFILHRIKPMIDRNESLTK
ncbi:DgyrCDS2102 [Dimorphilus gyrociliatus]|uniref:DgyrCDS2102 n=1 Tax=Dimorphilus gyrociliatus TaxID=2664684 RepID=A0A7I8VAJ6_9ANNE|nr:DgyrCDS2102 [Dimorphilus gyrociliatus]